MDALAPEPIDMSNRDRITVQLRDDWHNILPIPTKLPFQWLPAGVKGLGVVRRGSEPWGVLGVFSKTDEYVRISREGVLHRLDQRKIRAALDLPAPEGKPRSGLEVREPYTIRLEPSLAQYAASLGQGSLADGVTQLIQSHRIRAERKAAPVIEFPSQKPRAIRAVGVDFQAAVNGEVRDCRISFEAMRDHYHASGHEDDLGRTFIANKEEIHKAAKRLLNESSGNIIIGTHDIY